MSFVAAFYKFVELPDFRELRPALQARCEALDIKGTILLATEGINGTISGTRENVLSLLQHLRSDERLKDLTHKESSATKTPFYRMKVRLKREIVTLGVPGVDPSKMAGTYVAPKDWNKLLDDPSVVVVDVRNDYEVAIGTFKGALDPKTKSFSELPAWIRDQEVFRDKPKVAMFCTGGIRCEKSTAFMRAAGFDEVFHLEGGILKYLETIPESESRWQGECFVFDERVAVGQGLRPSHYELCRSCRNPVGEKEKASPLFVDGVSCPRCYGQKSAAKQQGLLERHKQIKLAKSRNQVHIGARLVPKKKIPKKTET